jgi:nucleoside-diphosphate-sugar epimerase
MNSQILSDTKLLIVGCGDIGARLAKILPTTFKITGLRRNPPNLSPTTPEEASRVHYEKCDATDPAQTDSILNNNRFDTIVMTMTPSERSDAGYERAYVQTCKNIVANLNTHAHKPNLLIFVSSTGVYGQNDGSWVNEDSPTQPDTFSGKRLLEAEQIILDSDVNHVIVRFSGIYGPGRNRLIDAIKQGRASDSLHYTNRIHVDDCAGALAHLIVRHKNGATLDDIYIATDSAPSSMREVIAWLSLQMSHQLSQNIQINTKAPNSTAQVSPQEGSNKRCSNVRLLDSGYSLRYPSYKEGYRKLLDTQ